MEVAKPKQQTRKHFVLVHGLCHGAWCWYKLKPLLESAGHKVTALDLATSGINLKTIQELRTFRDYTVPLMEFMASLPSGEKVILVGHSLGGMNLALAMDKFPEKISVAVFVTALMPDTVHKPSYVVEKAPPEGQFKINFDGAIGKAGVAGIGVVVRDFLGRVVAACTEQVAGLTDVDHVEALGALRATSLAMDLGLAWVQFEGDSLTVIRSMASDKEDLSNIGVVIDQIRSNLKSFCGSGCFHVKRSGNNVAHRLARMALSLDGFHVWMEEVPDSIASAVFAERSS